MKTFPKIAFVIGLAAVVGGCDIIPGGLAIGTGQTLKGKVSGSGLGAMTKVGIMTGSFLPADLGRADVASVGADGAWSYQIPSGRDSLTVFAFADANGNGKYDSGETNSYQSTSCPNCSYVVASLVGDAWKVAIKRSGTSSDTDLARANIDFSA